MLSFTHFKSTAFNVLWCLLLYVLIKLGWGFREVIFSPFESIPMKLLWPSQFWYVQYLLKWVFACGEAKSSTPWTLNILAIDVDAQCSMFTYGIENILYDPLCVWKGSCRVCVCLFFLFRRFISIAPSISNITKMMLQNRMVSGFTERSKKRRRSKNATINYKCMHTDKNLLHCNRYPFANSNRTFLCQSFFVLGRSLPAQSCAHNKYTLWKN